MYADILSDLVIEKVHSVSTMYSPEHKKAKRSNRVRWAVVMKYEGETLYTANDRFLVSDANHVILLPKGCSYAWQCTRAGHFSILEFDSPLVCAEPLVFSVKNGDRLLKLFRELEYKRNLKRPLMELESKRDAYAILLLLAQAESEQYHPTEKLKKLAPAMEYISQHYNTPLTNDALAARTGLSTVYFRKLFTAMMGISPMAYVHGLRMEKAKEVLKSEYGTLSDIARSVGYTSLYAFSRDFKKYTGIPPSRY